MCFERKFQLLQSAIPDVPTLGGADVSFVFEVRSPVPVRA